MNNEYLLPDGSPRYGIRTVERAEPQEPDAGPQATPGASVREAAEMGMHAMYFASRVRRYRPWARAMHPLTAELVSQFPNHFRDAGRIVEEQLGSDKAWRKRLSNDMSTVQREAGDLPVKGALSALAVTVGYVAAVITLVTVSARTDVFNAVQGIALIILLRTAFALAVRRITNSVRTAHSLRLTAAEREELRQDIQLATFLEVLDSQGVDVPPATSYRVLSGFRDIQASKDAVAGMKIA